MQDWKELAGQTITDPQELASILGVDADELEQVHREFPIRVNPYYLSLIKEKGDAMIMGVGH